MGKWPKIARLDLSFERDLERVTADYSLRKDGGITVINRGFSKKKASGVKRLARPFSRVRLWSIA
jgi:apolipoprotein D and lipocalin family protein